jgi:hypothetical protein
VTRFRFVEAEAAQFPVWLLCRVMGVTRQGDYAWRRRAPSARELADRKLAQRIKEIFDETDEIYGAPRGLLTAAPSAYGLRLRSTGETTPLGALFAS